ncbi:MAG: site-specific integrase [Actinobacteria bacterium]|nr:site-specific integrase [Actinomycetota bacterium]
MRGHLKKRAKGSWTLVVERGRDPVTGKRRQMWVTVKGSKKHAEAELARLINSVETGSEIEPANQSVAEYLERWLQACEGRLKPRTLQRYRELMTRHASPVIGGVDLRKLRPLHIEKMLRHCRDTGLSERTVLHVYRVLHTALAQAVKWQLLERNVAASVTPPKPAKRSVDAPDPADIIRLLQSVQGTEIEMPTVVAIGTGMRLGEVLGLRWVDLDLGVGSARVVQTVQVDRTFGTPKTHRSSRPIGLPQFVIDALKAHRKTQNESRLVAGGAWQEFDLVSCRPDGTPLDPRRVSRLFTATTHRLGLKMTFHGLRHAYASLMLLSGVDLKVISGLLGHSSIGITADLYLHVTERANQEAASKLDALLRGEKR